MEYAIIGGTGVYGLGEEVESLKVYTEYGDVEVDVVKFHNIEVAFLSRHGKDHSAPPHLINYRANIMALKKLGVKYVFATAAVGSCSSEFEPGDIVVVKDFLDFTKNRKQTFFEGHTGVKHVEMSNPYCKNLRERFYNRAEEFGVNIKGDAVYACTEGPRFETAQEIKMYSTLGGEVVGMTNVPEVVLAKEMGMCYAAVGIITNWCTGIKDVISHNLTEVIGDKKEKITEIFLEIFKEELNQRKCNCNNSLIEL